MKYFVSSERNKRWCEELGLPWAQAQKLASEIHPLDDDKALAKLKEIREKVKVKKTKGKSPA